MSDGDAILTARLDALEENLKYVENLNLARGDQSLWEAFQWQHIPVKRMLPEWLAKAMAQHAQDQLDVLNSIRASLKVEGPMAEEANRQKRLTEAWRRCVEVEENCQQFFAECLEVIGGLIFRDLSLDRSLEDLEDRIYQVADELIADSVKKSTREIKDLAPTVPAIPETLIKTLVRVVGLRFPEWTIWTLPFTAHELGHVLIHAVGKLKRVVDGWVDKPPGGARKWTANHLHEFLADAFATYTMGPAYACAVILLKFNPVAAHLEDNESPADARRAYLVFEILEQMNRLAPLESPYTVINGELKTKWEALLERVGQAPALSDEEQEELHPLMDAIWNQLRERFLPSAMYTPGGSDSGWGVAVKWSNMWGEQLKKGELLEIEQEDVSNSSTLRDVLNAAWLCRLLKDTDPVATREIAGAAHQLCGVILQKRRQQREQSEASYSSRETIR